MKIYDGLYIPKGFQPEDKNGFVNLYSDSDMNLRIRNGVVLKGTKISIISFPTESETIALNFSSWIENKKFACIAFYADGKIDYVDENINHIAIIKDDGTPISEYGTITLLEEPSDKVYNLLKKYYNIKNKEETIKQLVTQQDSELKFNNLSKLILGGGTNGTLSIQRPNTNQEVFQITGLNSNPKVFFKNHISIWDSDTYVSYSKAFGSKPLQIRQAFISDGSINNGTITNNSEGNMVGLLFNETKEFSSENIDTIFSFFVDNDLKKGMVTYEIEIDVNSTIYRGFGTVFLKKGEISSTRIYQSGSNTNWLKLDWARSNNSLEIMLTCGLNEIDIKSLIVW